MKNTIRRLGAALLLSTGLSSGAMAAGVSDLTGLGMPGPLAAAVGSQIGNRAPKQNILPFQSRFLDGVPCSWSRSLGYNGLSTAGDPGGTTQLSFICPIAIHDIRAVFGNILNTANQQNVPPNPVTYSLFMETGGAAPVQWPIGGATAVTLQPNTIAKTDPLPIGIPAGQTVTARVTARIALPPIGVLISGQNTGGTLAAGNYFYKFVSDTGVQGLSGGSAEVGWTITGTGVVNLAGTLDPLSVGASRVLVYRGTTSGANVLIDSIPVSGAQGSFTYTDTGAKATPAAWTASQTGVAIGTRQTSNGNVYLARVGGNGGTTAPSGTSAFSDGTIRWVYVGPAAPPAAQQIPNGGIVNYFAAPGVSASSAVQAGGNGGDYGLVPGRAWNGGSPGFAYGPFAIMGSPDAGYNVPVVDIQGDSITVGYNQGGGTQNTDQGDIAMALQNANIAYWSTGRAGETLRTGFLPDNRNRMLFARAATDVEEEYGINDIYVNGDSLATLQASKITLWQQDQGASSATAPRVWSSTLLPLSTSTDNWATAVNQTPGNQEATRLAYNAWMRDFAPLTSSGGVLTPAAVGSTTAIRAGQAGHPLSGIFDRAARVEVDASNTASLTGGRWISNGTAQAYTNDGTHPTTNADLLLAPATDTTRFVAP